CYVVINGQAFSRREGGKPCPRRAVRDTPLGVEALRMVTDRPWGAAPDACSGLTMADYYRVVAEVEAPDWAKRAAVSLGRSCPTSLGDVAAAAREIAEVITAGMPKA